MGCGDSQLTEKLITNYFKLIVQEERVINIIALYADAVKLACSGSSVLKELKVMAERGTKIFICTTCLNHYDIASELQVGQKATMMDIIDIQYNADKIIML